MYSVMIVDDDFVIRTTLKDIIDWHTLGFNIIGEAKNGKLAWDYLQNHDVNVLLTDMKMPIIDGLELIKKLKGREIVVIALSSFDEFELVREAFKLGIEDYLLKSHLEQTHLTELMNKVRIDLDSKCIKIEPILQKSVLKNFLAGVTEQFDDGHMYVIIQIDLSDDQKFQGRFKDRYTDLIEPMKKLILQIPSVTDKCECHDYKESCLILRYHNQTLEHKNITRVCKNIYTVIKNYMNLEVTIGVSTIKQGVDAIEIAIKESTMFLNQRYIFGECKIYDGTEKEPSESINFDYLEKEKEQYEGLLKAFLMKDNEVFMQQEEKLFSSFHEMSPEDIKRQCLYIIYLECIMLKNMGSSIWSVFGKNVSFLEKLERLTDANQYKIWMYNFNRFLFDYIQNLTENKAERTFEVVRKYIMDNYADADLNLIEVASIAGLNESYFSYKFKKEFGTGFSEYLKNVRVNHAKQLMKTSNLKIYEISQAVGYRNVEHFTRVFKSCVGISPKKYME